MNLSRRDFLGRSTLLGFGTSLPMFLSRTALAAPATGRSGARDTILVVVQLTGGNDGLNTVIPYADPEYRKLRPTIGIAKNDVKKLTDELGLHPAMTGFAGLYEKSQLTVIQAVGYPNPSQSHFRSMDIWQAASTEEELTEGWLGQAMKQQTLPGFHLAASGNETAPLALAGAPTRVPSLTSLADFQLRSAATDAADKNRQQQLIASTSQATSSASPPLLDFVRRTAAETYASSERLQKLSSSDNAKAVYPNTPLANRLKLAAQLIDAEVGARVIYLSLDGFDTHAGQGAATGAHANLLQTLSDGIAAFFRDLSARGQAERVCLMTFSEFGRRARENGSAGTDHGSAAPMFLAGPKVRPGVVGKHPSLTRLDAGNLAFAIDFRRIYAAILTDWLGIDSAPIVGKAYPKWPDLFVS